MAPYQFDSEASYQRGTKEPLQYGSTATQEWQVRDKIPSGRKARRLLMVCISVATVCTIYMMSGTAPSAVAPMSAAVKPKAEHTDATKEKLKANK
eukprot:CAMPEP_0205831268 /NCGR_PEP_ID=MMETSP0206-20130828/43594_1 /ASSEMBLY_ACC=CAM_ASM_000279 /TAXON_ID=36767 /ORGANISM="Euplotes focardii, Strain TN1" /LENGTH=94 /DNA_ID=CAMNT_0053135747 /DNA_START=44 /DNA_END=325 /DNA_ORIENTATION=+